jgi:hypothetical protein
MCQRRLSALRVTGELLQDMFRTSPSDQWFRIENGVPQDARFVRMDMDTSGGRSDLIAVYEHESFPPYTPGSRVPCMITPALSAIFRISPTYVERIHRERDELHANEKRLYRGESA